MSTFLDPAEWAQQEFGSVDLGDQRRTKRLVRSAELLSTRPSGSLPQRLDWNELRGFYRLVDQSTATPDRLQEGHRQRTRERMNRTDPVLIIHDTTELDYTSHPALHPQVGPIGNGHGKGVLQHNSLAFAPKTHELLGLVYQQMELRQPQPDQETRSKRRLREDRESHLWTDGIAGVGPAPEGCLWVNVVDSGGDIFAVMQQSLALNHAFLIRLCQNRKVVLDDAQGEEIANYLRDAAREFVGVDTQKLEIASRGGRPARVADLQIAWQRMQILPPTGEAQYRGAEAIELTVIRVWEPNPPAGVEGLEWVLGCSLEVKDAAQAWQYRDWYEYRWPLAEDYHKVEKTGCGEQELRFETWPRMAAALAVIAVIAVRVLSLRWQWDSQPHADAERVASRLEIALVAKVTKGAKAKRYTVKWFVESVAKLGGYLGRRGDGPPGWMSLWRGYQRLADILLGYELIHDPDESD